MAAPASRSAISSARACSASRSLSLVGGIFFIGVYWLIRRAGRAWWLWSGGLAALALAFVMLLSPVLIEPLFNKYEPVPPGQVRDAVVSHGRPRGHPARTRSTCSTDRASRTISPPMPAASAARRGWRFPTSRSRTPRSTRSAPSPGTRSAITCSSTPGGGSSFYSIAGDRVLLARRPAVPALCARVRKQRGDRRSARHSGAAVHRLAARPDRAAAPQHLLSRTLESQADIYSLRTENRPDALSTALVKTAEYRYPRPSAIEEIMFYDHPSVERRVLHARWNGRRRIRSRRPNEVIDQSGDLRGEFARRSPLRAPSRSSRRSKPRPTRDPTSDC